MQNNIIIKNKNVTTDIWSETIEHIEKASYHYLGITTAHLIMLKKCSAIFKIPLQEIYILLRKIKRNENTKFCKVENKFSITSNNNEQLYTTNILRYLPLMANYFLSYAIHPSVFNGTFCGVTQFALGHEYLIKNDIQAIIFIYYINIEKPVDPIRDYLTLSDKSKSNVIKYLISVTPNGYIDFVSSGYGGRATDAEIVEYSSYFSTLKLRSNILLFDDFWELVPRIGCQIIRLSSLNRLALVANNKKKKMSTILSNYIYYFIAQLQSFSFLKSVKAIPLNEAQLLDDSIKIACSLINLKTSFK